MSKKKISHGLNPLLEKTRCYTQHSYHHPMSIAFREVIVVPPHAIYLYWQKDDPYKTQLEFSRFGKTKNITAEHEHRRPRHSCYTRCPALGGSKKFTTPPSQGSTLVFTQSTVMCLALLQRETVSKSTTVSLVTYTFRYLPQGTVHYPICYNTPLYMNHEEKKSLCV